MKNNLNDIFGAAEIKERRKVTVIILGAFLLVLVCIFGWYFNATQTTAIETSSKTANQIGIQTADTIHKIFDRAESTIKLGTIAIGTSGSENAYKQGAVDEYVKQIESIELFTKVCLISSDGYSHFSEGRDVNVRDREYYIKGMAGESGYTFIESSKETGRPVLGYYAPIYENADSSKEVKGVLVGFLEQEALTEILQSEESLFDTYTALCLPDGTFLAVNNKAFLQVGVKFYDKPPTKIEYLDENGMEKVIEAMKSRQEYHFNFRGSGGISAGSVIPVENGEIMIYQLVSSESIGELQRKLINLSRTTILLMIAAFFVMLFFVRYFDKAHKKKLAAYGMNMSYISRAIEADYDCFILIDLIKGTYKYLAGNGLMLQELPPEGYVKALPSFFEVIMVSQEEKEEVRRIANADRFQELFSHKREIKECYEVQFGDARKWENINILALERDKEDKAVKLLLTVQDATEYKLKEEESLHRTQLIQMLLGNYSSAYEVDMKTGECQTLRKSKFVSENYGEFFLDNMLHEERCLHYAERCVPEDYRHGFLEITSLKYMRDILKNQQYFTYTYLEEKMQREPCYIQIKAARINKNVDSVVYGFSNVNDEMQAQIKQRQLLMNALNQAENANMAKSTFLSNMSHDIRTPMNAVLGFTSLAQIHIDEKEKVNEYLQKIEKSGKYLLSLINNVLDMSRIESGKIVLEETICSISEVIEETGIMFQEQAHSKGIQLTVDTYGIIDDYVYLDKLRMNQVLQNLISNAIKFTKEGGKVSVRVREKAEESRDEAGYEIIVKDNGIGMTPEFIQHIWEPFERKSSAVDANMGTGLGTAIVKNLVEMMGGDISVKSELGKGTEFRIYLSLRKEEEYIREERLQKEAKTFETGGSARIPMPARGFLDETEELDVEDVDISLELARKKRTQGYTVKKLSIDDDYHDSFSQEEVTALVQKVFAGKRFLLVDDNELNREIGVELLKDQGAEVDVAANGRKAVEIIEKAPSETYDLIFMDVQMPLMNGYEATKCIRALDDEKKANLPIVAMTANAFADDVDAAFQAGMNGHISKPVSIEKIYSTIKQMI